MCENCNTQFDIHKNIPYLLPCGHSICKKCLHEQWTKYNYIKCYSDGNKHHQGLNHYPLNSYLIDVISEYDQSKSDINRTNEIRSIGSFTVWKQRNLFGFKIKRLALPLWSHYVKMMLFNWIKVEDNVQLGSIMRIIRWIVHLIVALVVHYLLIRYSDFIIFFVFIVLINETLSLIREKKKADSDPKYNNEWIDRGRNCNRKWLYAFVFLCGKQLIDWLEVRVIFSILPRLIFAFYITS